MTTLKISIYAGILISLPVLLYQAYAFLLPGVEADRAARRAAVPVPGPGAVHRGRGVLVLRRRPGGDQVPARTSTRASSTSRCGRAATTASSSSPWPRSGSSSRCPMGILRADPARDHDPRAALPQSPLRVPDPRDRRDAAPGNRPGDDADRAGAAPGPVRVLADPGADSGHAGRRGAACPTPEPEPPGKPRQARLRGALRPSWQAPAARPGRLLPARGVLSDRLRVPGHRRRRDRQHLRPVRAASSGGSTSSQFDSSDRRRQRTQLPEGPEGHRPRSSKLAENEWFKAKSGRSQDPTTGQIAGVSDDAHTALGSRPTPGPST